MEIKVKLFATLREGREKEQIMTFDQNACPSDIFQLLKIPETEVAILLINGMNGDLNQPLKHGDTVSVFPPVGGG